MFLKNGFFLSSFLDISVLKPNMKLKIGAYIFINYGFIWIIVRNFIVGPKIQVKTSFIPKT
jgi:hypothetical protein